MYIQFPDVTCLNENCHFLRQLIDEIGSNMRSSAVCTQVRRYRDGIFLAEDEHTLLTRDVTVQKIIDASSHNFKRLISLFKQNSMVYHDWDRLSRGVS